MRTALWIYNSTDKNSSLILINDANAESFTSLNKKINTLFGLCNNEKALVFTLVFSSAYPCNDVAFVLRGNATLQSALEGLLMTTGMWSSTFDLKTNHMHLWPAQAVISSEEDEPVNEPEGIRLVESLRKNSAFASEYRFSRFPYLDSEFLFDNQAPRLCWDVPVDFVDINRDSLKGSILSYFFSYSPQTDGDETIKDFLTSFSEKNNGDGGGGDGVDEKDENPEIFIAPACVDVLLRMMQKENLPQDLLTVEKAWKYFSSRFQNSSCNILQEEEKEGAKNNLSVENIEKTTTAESEKGSVCSEHGSASEEEDHDHLHPSPKHKKRARHPLASMFDEFSERDDDLLIEKEKDEEEEEEEEEKEEKEQQKEKKENKEKGEEEIKKMAHDAWTKLSGWFKTEKVDMKDQDIKRNFSVAEGDEDLAMSLILIEFLAKKDGKYDRLLQKYKNNKKLISEAWLEALRTKTRQFPRKESFEIVDMIVRSF